MNDNTGLQKLSDLIGIDLTPDTSECSIFATAISSILIQYWRSIDMFSTDADTLPDHPAFIVGSSARIENNKFYFDIDASDPNFTSLEYILTAAESALINLQGIQDITIQGSRMLITGTNAKVFSVTFFEVSEQFNTDINRDTKSWLMHVNISAL